MKINGHIYCKKMANVSIMKLSKAHAYIRIEGGTKL